MDFGDAEAVRMFQMKSNDDIDPCLTAVMPVYNESATVAKIVSVVLAQRPVQQLVIVDDCSQDGTWDQLLGLGSGIRPGRVLSADRTNSVRQGGRGVRFAVSRRQ